MPTDDTIRELRTERPDGYRFHFDPPAPEPEDRLCACGHSLDEDHISDRPPGQIGCTVKGCKCRDFVCWQHPDGDCFDD